MKNDVYTQSDLRRLNILTMDYVLNLEPGDFLAVLDLKAEVFHFDHHETLLPRLREAYGERIAVRVEGRGNLFTLSIVDPALTPGEIKARFPMQTYREYHRGATRDNLEILESYPEVDS